MRIFSLAAVILCTLSLTPRAALAWSDDGHRIIAMIADHYLLPPARDKVNALLKGDTDQLTAHDIANAATWADRVRDKDPARTSQWHFLEMPADYPNIPKACNSHDTLPANTAASEGPANACIIDKINQFAQELDDPNISSHERLLALKYLLNLVGDIHQPLRMVDEGNHHGADLAVSAPLMTPGDLFTFWESILILRIEGNATPNDVAHTLIARITAGNQRLWGSRTPQLWALEAYQLGVDNAYGMIRAHDDQGRGTLQDREIEIATQTVALQLSRAGVRLAYVLNGALAPSALAASLPAHVKTGNAAAGKEFAQVRCAVCHNVAPGQNKGGIVAPDFAAVAKTSGVTEAALAEFLSGPHPTMPNIHLTRKQSDDLIAYIISLR